MASINRVKHSAIKNTPLANAPIISALTHPKVCDLFALSLQSKEKNIIIILIIIHDQHYSNSVKGGKLVVLSEKPPFYALFRKLELARLRRQLLICFFVRYVTYRLYCSPNACKSIAPVVSLHRG